MEGKMGLFGFIFGKKNKNSDNRKIKSPTVQVKSGDVTELALPEEHSYKLEKKADTAPKTGTKAKMEDSKTPVKKQSARQTAPAENRVEKQQTPHTEKKAKVQQSSPTKKTAEAQQTSPTEKKAKIQQTPAPVQEAKAVRGRGRFEIKKTKDDRYVFNLYASNHVIIATSQVYSSPQSALTGIKSVMANAEKAALEDQTSEGYTKLPYPKWEMYIDGGKQYRFRLSASNGSCVCHSQGYTKKTSCRNGIESIKKFAKDAEIDKAYIKKD